MHFFYLKLHPVNVQFQCSQRPPENTQNPKFSRETPKPPPSGTPPPPAPNHTLAPPGRRPSGSAPGFKHALKWVLIGNKHWSKICPPCVADISHVSPENPNQGGTVHMYVKARGFLCNNNNLYRTTT